jgi:hypothetical protein
MFDEPVGVIEILWGFIPHLLKVIMLPREILNGVAMPAVNARLA